MGNVGSGDPMPRPAAFRLLSCQRRLAPSVAIEEQQLGQTRESDERPQGRDPQGLGA